MRERIAKMALFNWGRNSYEQTDQYVYSDKERKLYEQYIVDQFGSYNEVYHEIVSDGIHLDIMIIPPSEDANYYKLITMGAGAFKMNVPKEYKKYELERAEFIMLLPPTWNIKSSEEENYWPIKQLKNIARLSIDNNSWLGYGHTVSADEACSAYASNTKFCSMVLVNAVNPEYDNLDFSMGRKEKINFYLLFPLYREELNFVQSNGVSSFLELVSDDDLLPVLNTDRRNYCGD